jgi:hypothetical protein
MQNRTSEAVGAELCRTQPYLNSERPDPDWLIQIILIQKDLAGFWNGGWPEIIQMRKDRDLTGIYPCKTVFFPVVPRRVNHS